jgi:hypothetical protein
VKTIPAVKPATYKIRIGDLSENAAFARQHILSVTHRLGQYSRMARGEIRGLVLTPFPSRADHARPARRSRSIG